MADPESRKLLTGGYRCAVRFGSLVLFLQVLACAASPSRPALGSDGRDGVAGSAGLHAPAVSADTPAAGGGGGGLAGVSGQGAASMHGQGSAGASVTGGYGAGSGGAVSITMGGGGLGGAGRAGSMSSVDAGSGSGCAGASFCESFDSPTGAGLDLTRWDVVAPNCSGDADAQIDSEVAHSGTRSLRVRGGAGYCNHLFIAPKAVTFEASGALYGRFYVRLSSVLPAAHVTFMALRDGRESKDLRLGGQSEILIWNRESDDATLPELSPKGIAASVKLEAQVWTCIEFAVEPAARTLHTWVDGQALVGLQVEGDATPDLDAQWQRKPDWQPRIEGAKWGWESYGDKANTVWFDDIALGSNRIGCGP